MRENRAAILLDGGFVKKKLQETLGRFPTHNEVAELCQRTMAKPRLAGKELFRIYWYDAPPFRETSVNPIDQTVVDFSATPQSRAHQALLDALAMMPDFAVRRGEIIMTGWRLGSRALDDLKKTPRTIRAHDFVPDFKQTGVDMRIGLDIAWISLKQIVDTIVLVTGDSDFVPAMKFARREGLKVYLETMGHGVRPALREHTDCLL